MRNYSELKIEQIWKRAKAPNKNEKHIWRKDIAGAWIKRDQYRKETDYGWEINHMIPESKGGSDDILNLHPFHWRNNRTKGDHYPDFQTSVTSHESSNIDKATNLTFLND